MKALVLEEIEAYAHEHTTPESDLLRELRDVTYARMKLPQMQVGRVEGAFLRLLVRLTRARSILEIGMFTGYSTLMMAEGLPEGGRLVTTFDDGSEFEVGRISAWQPGERLALSWRQASFAPEQTTFLDVRFEPVGDETRVTVEHRGWETIPQRHAARHGFELILFQRRQGEHWRALLAALGARVSTRRR